MKAAKMAKYNGSSGEKMAAAKRNQRRNRFSNRNGGENGVSIEMKISAKAEKRKHLGGCRKLAAKWRNQLSASRRNQLKI